MKKGVVKLYFEFPDVWAIYYSKMKQTASWPEWVFEVPKNPYRPVIGKLEKKACSFQNIKNDNDLLV